MSLLRRALALAARRTGGLPTLAARNTRDMRPSRLASMASAARNGGAPSALDEGVGDEVNLLDMLATDRGRVMPPAARSGFGDRSAYNAGLGGDAMLPLGVGAVAGVGAATVPAALAATQEHHQPMFSDPAIDAANQRLGRDEDALMDYEEMRLRKLREEMRRMGLL